MVGNFIEVENVFIIYEGILKLMLVKIDMDYFEVVFYKNLLIME